MGENIIKDRIDDTSIKIIMMNQKIEEVGLQLVKINDNISSLVLKEQSIFVSSW